MVVDGTYYAQSHGDAYPRALGFSAWSDDPAANKNSMVNAQYFAIPGTTGVNTKDTQTSGFAYLPDGNFGVVFASSIGRTKRDVCMSPPPLRFQGLVIYVSFSCLTELVKCLLAISIRILSMCLGLRSIPYINLILLLRIRHLHAYFAYSKSICFDSNNGFIDSGTFILNCLIAITTRLSYIKKSSGR
jgi:hypothetical protein